MCSLLAWMRTISHRLTTICWSARAAEIGNSSAITGYGPCFHLQTGCVQQGDVGGHVVAVLCNRSPTPSRLTATKSIMVKNVPRNQPRTSAILSKFGHHPITILFQMSFHLILFLLSSR